MKPRPRRVRCPPALPPVGQDEGIVINHKDCERARFNSAHIERPRPVPLPTPLVVEKGSVARLSVRSSMPSLLSSTDRQTKLPTKSQGPSLPAPFNHTRKRDSRRLSTPECCSRLVRDGPRRRQTSSRLAADYFGTFFRCFFSVLSPNILDLRIPGTWKSNIPSLSSLIGSRGTS